MRTLAVLTGICTEKQLKELGAQDAGMTPEFYLNSVGVFAALLDE